MTAQGKDKQRHPVTPDGRYFVVRGRLWRMSDPRLDPEVRERLVADLMAARRAISKAKRENSDGEIASARAAVDAAKHRLGERGQAWWGPGEPDYNRHLAKNTPYAGWFAGLSSR